MSGTLLIYGASGFVGRLVARQAVRVGLEPVLAGRQAASIAGLAGELNLPVREARVDDPAALDAALDGVGVVLNCAGPFWRTCVPVAGAAIRAGAHYIDVAGEVPEFRSVAALGDAASAAGSMLMPGAGLAVVPTDCLSLHLAQRLPGATRLQIAFHAVGGVSRGTARTVYRSLHATGVVRRGGQLVPARPGERRLRVDLGEGPTTVVTDAWNADLFSAGLSTGIPDIETYTLVPAPVRALMRSTPVTGPILGSRAAKGLLERVIRRLPEGPSEEQLAKGSTHVWGRAFGPSGATAEALVHGPEAYVLTARSAVLVAQRALGGDAPPGFQTPAKAYGPDLMLEVEGITREDR
jgi:short subunit dehydrogenase-like uncharacterized protein